MANGYGRLIHTDGDVNNIIQLLFNFIKIFLLILDL
jgi:hypothetical protein